VPERRYDLAGHIMAEAITTAQRTGEPLDGALATAARAAGARLVRDARPGDGVRSDRLASVCELLAGNGFEPRRDGDHVTLGNCPFHRLAESYTALVCGMNLHLIGGLLDALRADELSVQLTPAPGKCCVTVRVT
jgi:predicted ArsR family transcriptional regulator